MKKSLTLCASIVLLSPLVNAKALSDWGLDIAIGHRDVAIGDRTSSPTAKTLLGGAKDTTTTASTGTVTALEHSTPEAIVSGSALFNVGNGHNGIRLAVDIHVANSDTHKVYDGKSETAKVIFDGYGAAAGTTSTVDADEVAANFGVTSISAGQRECTVSHQAAYGIRAMYAFGRDDANVNIGLGYKRTQDEYKYVVDEDPAAAVAGNGVFSSTVAYNFQLPATDNSTTQTLWSTDTGVTEATRTYLPVAGTTEKTNESINWIGIVAEGCSPISDTLVATAGYAYYWGTFSKGTTGATHAVMVTKDTDGYMATGHFGIGFRRSDK